ncbi:MAG TPA: transcriptional regulator [Methanothermococcus okinawensis]|uniref:Putative HTH-type transcriptional regulatory protein EYH15_01980 n=1 Tax=Methanothermococcus okinawensis TaxID=155863 RepID=A0A832ZGZ9_9EURY|nr:transcriptional regulator [Methanothermococcus okinawensis]HIP91713.1 transcriptional regulator [Methanothermococcus okinawensis]
MREILLSECIEVLQRFNFMVSQTFGRSCFDILARRGVRKYLIKVLKNIDSLSYEQSLELLKLSKILGATPLLIGMRTRNMPMEDGVVYERHNIKAITLNTFEAYLEGNPPVVYAGRGGFFVNIDGETLRSVREKLNISIGELAEYCNVSRKMIYKYEQNLANPTIEVALRIEEYLDTPLIRGISLEVEEEIEDIGLEGYRRRSRSERERDFKLYVISIFQQLGFNTTEIKRAPFDAVVEKEDIEEYNLSTLLLTNIEERETEETRQRMLIVNQLSSVLNSSSLLVLEKEDSHSIDYVKAINIRELERMEDASDLLEYIASK